MTWDMKSLPGSQYQLRVDPRVAFLYVVLMAGPIPASWDSDETFIQHFWEEIMVQIDDLWLWVYIVSIINFLNPLDITP